ncbi:MAG: post-COAP-1 domain-containing protein [Chloroflexota bacterium]|nr:hypothetical protein [Chloroflexota bacterium]
MKAKYILVGLLMVALVMGGTGYSVSAGPGDKVTGGGTFINWTYPNDYAQPGDKVSFGFNAQITNGEAKGQFNLVNHNSGLKLKGTITDVIPSTLGAQLNGTLEGSGIDFYVIIQDGGNGANTDVISIYFDDISGRPEIYGSWSKGIKGNIQKHK